MVYNHYQMPGQTANYINTKNRIPSHDSHMYKHTLPQPHEMHDTRDETMNISRATHPTK